MVQTEKTLEINVQDGLNESRRNETQLSMARRAINYVGERFQTATSFPYPKDNKGIDGPFINEHLRQSTLRHAQRDNRMIDRYTAEIAKCEDKIVENTECGNYSQFSLDNANSQIYTQAQQLREDVNSLKTSKTTADDIDSRNRGDVKRWPQANHGHTL